MKGTVAHIAHAIGWIAIRDEIGEITIAELLGGYDIEIGNRITGDLHSLGGETFYNQSEDEEIDVFVQYINLSEQQAIQIFQTRVL